MREASVPGFLCLSRNITRPFAADVTIFRGGFPNTLRQIQIRCRARLTLNPNRPLDRKGNFFLLFYYFSSAFCLLSASFPLLNRSCSSLHSLQETKNLLDKSLKIEQKSNDRFGLNQAYTREKEGETSRLCWFLPPPNRLYPS